MKKKKKGQKRKKRRKGRSKQKERVRKKRIAYNLPKVCSLDKGELCKTANTKVVKKRAVKTKVVKKRAVKGVDKMLFPFVISWILICD